MCRGFLHYSELKRFWTGQALIKLAVDPTLRAFVALPAAKCAVSQAMSETILHSKQQLRVTLTRLEVLLLD